MNLRSQCCVEKAVPNNNANPDAYVETNPKDNHLEAQIPVDKLPSEILFLILERLDEVSLFYCFFVCKRWRSIVISLANGDKTNMMWYFLYRQYQMEGVYQQNSNSNCLLPLQELIESSLIWNYKCSISLSITVPVMNALQMNVYRENIIVVTSQGVKYFDKKTFKIKKTISLDECHYFIENDYMVARSIKYDNGKGYYKLQLFGKRTFDDCEWESQIVTSGITQGNNSTQELDVRLFKIKENCCFVILKYNNSLNSYDWRKYVENPMEWHRRFRCRYYGSMGGIIAMDVGLNQVFLLTSSGALLCYQRGTKGVFAKAYSFSGFMQSRFVQLAHRNNLVLSVPDDCPPRITRIRKSGVTTLYRLEIPKLTCVTEHGIFLFLGFSDGKVKIMSPMNSSREYMFKHSIDLSVFKKEPPAPVVSIAVCVDNGKQSIFVATTSCIYRLTPTFSDETNIWDKENIVSLLYVPKVDLVSI